jgi:hypothetical protein
MAMPFCYAEDPIPIGETGNPVLPLVISLPATAR